MNQNESNLNELAYSKIEIQTQKMHHLGVKRQPSSFLQEPHRVYPSIPASQRRPLRVLSLFDGIATGESTLVPLLTRLMDGGIIGRTVECFIHPKDLFSFSFNH